MTQNIKSCLKSHFLYFKILFGEKQREESSKYFLLCLIFSSPFDGKILAYKFGTTGGRVNDDVFLKKRYIYMYLFVFQIGERIRVILDMDDKTLAFERGFEFLGVAFRGLPKTCLFPAVSAVYGNTEVTLVYLGRPLDG